jgi:hypothetical protein
LDGTGASSRREIKLRCRDINLGVGSCCRRRNGRDLNKSVWLGHCIASQQAQPASDGDEDEQVG